ncbi:PREDICTED: uncharacterized protein LOC109236682 [Nicotiana attenuata]|uniref:uncharacterized protein LOC109236682 n=1 Tax=Nicotiana attenuata TaxID=49451 RepID=UPI000904700B|nr:PREDICTED: uncharacterized protein LOC109236682 [Nicotiana attenuata]
MAETSKTVPQKEKASSSRPAAIKRWWSHALRSAFPGAASWVPGAILNLESWVRKLASTSSYAERSWRDLAKGRWEAKNHGKLLYTDIAVMSPSTGEQEAPKPAKDKKRKRVSPSDTPKPKKSKARRSKKDTAALPADVAQRLMEEEEEDEDADFELVARAKRVPEAPKAAETVTIEEVQPRTEEISEGGPSKVPESSEAEDASPLDEKSADLSEGAGSVALRDKKNAPSDLLGSIDVDDSLPLPTFFEGKIQEAHAMGTPNVGMAHEGEDLFHDCFTGVEDASDLGDASSIFNEAHRLLSKALMLHREAFSKSWAELNRCEADLKRLTKERNALKLLSGQKEEEIKFLRAELATTHEEQTDLIEQVPHRVEKIEQLREEANMMRAETLGWKQNMDHLASEKETARAQPSSAERQLQSMKEESSAQAKKMKELEAS